MRFNILKCLLLLISLMIGCVFNLSYAATHVVETQLSADKINLGDTVTVSYSIDDDLRTSPDYSALETDFYILSRNYGTAVNMINGNIKSQTFWRLTLEPKKKGTLIIPEIQFGDAKSSARQLIVEENSKASVNTQQDAPAFVQAMISTKKPYVQSQVVYTFKLFYRAQFENPRLDIPQIEDATFVQFDDVKQYQTKINGKPYMVIEKSFAFFPKTPGKLIVPAARFRALSYNANDTRLDNPFVITATKPVSLATDVFKLTVQNIPDEFSGKIWLPANKLILSEKWSHDPKQWELGNPLTRTITVEAKGLRADQLPDLLIDQIAGVNVYVDPPKRSNKMQDNEVIGILEQKVTYIPNVSQSVTIPALKINWWNLSKNTNAVAQLPSFTIRVHRQIETKIEDHPKFLDTNLAQYQPISVPLPNSVATLKSKAIPFYLSIWFWVAIILFILWIMTIGFIWFKKWIIKFPSNRLSKRKHAEASSLSDITETGFTKACAEGNAMLAQRYLLSWAKKSLPDTPLNLETLRELNTDPDFKRALEGLEQAIYAKKTLRWDGSVLLAAYHKVKKVWPQVKDVKNKVDKDKLDLLPPLYPT